MRRALAFALAGLLAAASAPAQAKPKPADYAGAEWRLVRVYAPTPELQRGFDVWVLEADLKAAAKHKKRRPTVRVMMREAPDGPWSVATNRYACRKDEMRVLWIERFMPGGGAPSVEKGGEAREVDPGGPDAAVERLVCYGGEAQGRVVRGRAAAFAAQDAADAAYARAQAAGG